jgi:hypothetical protein
MSVEVPTVLSGSPPEIEAILRVLGSKYLSSVLRVDLLFGGAEYTSFTTHSARDSGGAPDRSSRDLAAIERDLRSIDSPSSARTRRR